MRNLSHLLVTPLIGVLLGGVVVGLPENTSTQAPTAATVPATATARIVAAATALVATLDDAGKAKVQFPFDGPQKARWSNLPSGIFKREGLRLGDLTSAQRKAVMTLLTTALSSEGYRKVTEIMRGDEVLRTGQRGSGGGGGRGGQGSGPAFGEDEFYLAFLGTPSTSTPWMLQFGGHHLAINLTLAGAQSSMTPSLPAAQPATYTVEGREIRPLGKELDKGYALINALDESLRSQAILKFQVTDLVLGATQDGKVIQPEGLRASAMSPAQQAMLIELVREWAGIVTDGLAEPRMAEIKANLPQTYLAWSGPTAVGSVAYYRIQGPTLVIEFAPQRTLDHIHTIYRDPTNDYGAKFTKK